ncbi:MAG: methyl-accepting chemotaxis protein, partial [Synergistaceae bacterium]|nr:methyl-accepting chemotaxis protein [Synergistaceae bacterium]
MGWLNNLGIKSKLILSYIVLCVLMLFIGFAGINGLRTMSTEIRLLYNNSLVRISNIKEAAINIEHTRFLQVQAYVPENKDRLAALDAGAAETSGKIAAAIASYEETITEDEDRAMLQELRAMIGAGRQARIDYMDKVKEGDYKTASEIFYGRLSPTNDNINRHLAKMSDWNDNMGRTYMEIADRSYRYAMTVMTGIIIFGVISAFALGYFISRSIVNPLNFLIAFSDEIAAGNIFRKIGVTRSDEIGKLEKSFGIMAENLREVLKTVQESANSVAASSEELSAGAVESTQVANSVATSATSVSQSAETQLSIAGGAVSALEKFTTEIEQVIASANIVGSTSGQTAQAADKGGKAVETAVKQMTSIQHTVESLAKEITSLSMRSNEIGQIVETISGLAGQTNLLALNAAIEAARAGEQGRGFAVVAEEVRKLAEQSQEATKQISSLIDAIQNDTANAVQAMQAGTKEVETGSELVGNAGGA